MAVTDAPKIITSRFDVADGHTLDGYLRTGGYEGLKAALAKKPADVVEEVKTASLLKSPVRIVGTCLSVCLTHISL